MKIFLATPILGTLVDYGYMVSIVHSVKLLESRGHTVSVNVLPGQCYVQHGRNILVKKFLDSDADCMVFIDSDLVWKDKDLLRLVKCEEEFVCGLYPYKTEKENYPALIAKSASGTYIEKNGLILLDGAPTGFLKLNRSVFDKLLKSYKGLEINETDSQGREETYYNIFECKQIGDKWFGEDYYFCKLWTDIGGPIWAIPDIDFIHMGFKSYVGNYYNFATRGIK